MIFGKAVLVALTIPVLRSDKVLLIARGVVKTVANAVVVIVVVVSTLGSLVTASTVTFATVVKTWTVALPSGAEIFDKLTHTSLI